MSGVSVVLGNVSSPRSVYTVVCVHSGQCTLFIDRTSSYCVEQPHECFMWPKTFTLGEVGPEIRRIALRV